MIQKNPFKNPCIGVYIVNCNFLDYKSGFGGKFGVQNDRVDKCAIGWEHKEELTKHESQKGKYIASTILGLDES